MRNVTVVPHDARWSCLFEEEAYELATIFGEEVVQVHHIGSTAIPGIYAKPIVDVLVEVRDIEKIEACDQQMAERGYFPKGEFGIHGRRFFIKGNEGRRTHHVHVFQVGDAEAERHLAFRDYLRVHPEEAQAYSRLKQHLASRFPNDIDSYMDGKDDWIKETERKARAWKARAKKSDFR